MTDITDTIYKYVMAMADSAWQELNVPYPDEPYAEDVAALTVDLINAAEDYDAVFANESFSNPSVLPSGTPIDTEEIIVGGLVFGVGVIYGNNDSQPTGAYVALA